MAWCLACVHSRHGEDLLVNLLEGIDALLEVDIIRGQLSLRPCNQYRGIPVIRHFHEREPCRQLGPAAPWCTEKYGRQRE